MGINKRLKKHRALSSRQKQMIQILAQMRTGPITVAAISEKLGVSSRTILREIPAIEQWLEDNDFRFLRKPGVGLQIPETAEHLQLIEELLEIENIIPMYSRQERRRQLLGDLFFGDGPVKSYVFTSHYNISEGTLSEDLESLDAWLSDYQVSIVRKPGVGIFLRGEEVAIRQAIANAVFEFCEMDQILELMFETNVRSRELANLIQNPILKFINTEVLEFSERIMEEARRRLKVRYTDSGRIGLFIRIALAIYRIQHGHEISKPLQSKAQAKLLREYEVAGYMCEEIKKTFYLEISSHEVDYLALQLSSTRIWSDASAFADPMQAMNVRQVVMSMIGVVEQLTGLPFRDNSGLADDLVQHIMEISKRLSMNFITGNSQADYIRQNYPDIFSAVETACQVLREWVYPKEINEADIGFIAMHFAAAAEQLQEKAQKVIVAVVCPVGIGSSKMLAAGLMRSFHNIEIRKMMSAFDINTEQLQAEGIDLIISTAELRTDFPYICVGKILQVKDKLKIQNHIDELNRIRIQQKTSKGRRTWSALSLEDISNTSIIGYEIVEILQNFRISCVNKAENLHGMMDMAADIFSDSSDARLRIAKGFQRREELGDTYIPEMQICLFHCRTDALTHSRFGYLRLEKVLETDKGPVAGAVIMLVPEKIKDNCSLEPVGRLSALLVEEQGFLQALKSGDTAAGVAYAETALVKYYQNELKKRMGDENL